MAAPAPVVAAPAAPTAQSGGLLGWLRNMFGTAPPAASAPAPAAAPAAAPPPREERGTGNGKRRGGRDEKRAERGQDKPAKGGNAIQDATGRQAQPDAGKGGGKPRTDGKQAPSQPKPDRVPQARQDGKPRPEPKPPQEARPAQA